MDAQFSKSVPRPPSRCSLWSWKSMSMNAASRTTKLGVSMELGSYLKEDCRAKGAPKRRAKSSRT